MKRLTVLLVALLAPAALRAQMPNIAPRSVALAGAYTSLARGVEAVAWNPAMLGARGGPEITFALPRLSLELGSNTYSWQDFRHYANRNLTDQDKQDLLGKIALDDSVLTIRSIVGLAPIGISAGPVAITAATSGDMDLSLGRDAIELVLYGNAHRTGPGQYFTARGSSGRAWAATTIAGSIALPFNLPQGRLSVGATYKYVIGHFIGRANEVQSSFTVAPLLAAQAEGQALYTDYTSDYSPSKPDDILGGQGKAGSGYGVDLGATLQLGGRSATLSVALINAVGKMTWDAARLTYERTGYTLDQTTTGGVQQDSTHFVLTTPAAIEADPAARALRDSVLAHGDFARIARLGFALRSGALSLSADAHVRLKEGLDRQPARYVAGGIEYRLLGILPLRAGVGWDFGESLTLAGGAGLQLLGIHLDLSVASISGNVRPGAIFGVGVGLEY